MLCFYFITLPFGGLKADKRLLPETHNQATSAQLVSSQQAQISPTHGPAETVFSQACAEAPDAPRTSEADW